MLLQLLQSGTSLTGTLNVAMAGLPLPEHLLSSLKGKLKGTQFTLDALFRGRQENPVDGGIRGTLLTIEFEPGYDVVFQRGTVVQFDQQIARAQHVMTSSGAAADGAVQSSVMNAMADAMALFRDTDAYAANGHPYDDVTFTQHAPAFLWTPLACGPSPGNCISFQVMDLAAANDSQGLAVVAYSLRTATCWYAIDIATTPKILPNDPLAFERTAVSANTAASRAGVYYGKSAVGTNPVSCSASVVLHAQHESWGIDFTDAGGVG